MKAKAANPLNLTDVQKRTLRAMRACDAGPAYISGSVWPGHIALRKGAAPGTGLVRPMLAILARLKKAGLVEWYSRDGEPVVWTLTTRGMDAIYMPTDERIKHLQRRFQGT